MSPNPWKDQEPYFWSKFELEKESHRPTCGVCGKYIDDGLAVLEYQCRDCYVGELVVEINNLVNEFIQTAGITRTEATKSGVLTALLRLARYGRRNASLS